MKDEPVSITAAINAAILSTIMLLAFFGASTELIGALSAAAVGWVGVAAAVVRSRVTPTDKVALTKEQAAELGAREAGPR